MKATWGRLFALLLVLAAQAPMAGATVETGDDYRIGADDVLTIEFFGNPELNRKVRVEQNGAISLPLIGKLVVADLSPLEAQQKIARVLRRKGLMKDPQVSIFVEELNSRGVSVQGAVERPGVYQMVGSTQLLDAIGMAGGLAGGNERAGGTVLVIRAGDDEEQRIEIDIRRLFEFADMALNIPLQPGDVVMVPHEEVHRVYVSGAVESPGQVEFSSSAGITVLQAITAAGGPTERANLKKVFVLRRAVDGSQERLQVNVRRIRSGKEDDLLLRDNDTVDVGEHFF